MEEQGTGFITVNVRTAGGALPVEGAVITVRAVSGQGGSVVAVMITDSGGTSDVLSLPTPPKSNSLSPRNGAEVSSNYSIDTEKSGFYSVSNMNVPVFDGVTSVQQVMLVPFAGGGGIPYPEELTRFDDSATVPEL